MRKDNHLLNFEEAEESIFLTRHFGQNLKTRWPFANAPGHELSQPFKAALRCCLLIVFTFGVLQSTAQIPIKGIVTDSKGQSLPGANIMLKGTLDGATSDPNGNFSFTTQHTGSHILIASFMGYKNQDIILVISDEPITLSIKLREDAQQLGQVVITAGTFEAGDQRKSVTLRPLDIVTTPSAAGDIYGMLTSLPGAAPVGEDGRLFVRGGDAYESKTFIDGLMVRKPYSSSMPDLPSRGRFSPFLFSGTTFSTGGYSAEYGQALSSALTLNTNSFPEKTHTEISLMSVGLGATQTLKSDNSSVMLGVEYNNLQPYFTLIPQRHQWNQHPTSVGTTFAGHHKAKNQALIKAFATFSQSGSGLQWQDIGPDAGTRDLQLNNTNSYSQVSYIRNLGSWSMTAGTSAGFDRNKIDLSSFWVEEKYNNLQVKLRFKREFSKQLQIMTGAETSLSDYSFTYTERSSDFSYTGSFTDYAPALFAEMEAKPIARLAIRSGLRSEYASVLDQVATAWRLSAAWLLNSAWQASVAMGSFYQTPEEEILRYGPKLQFEKATHFIANLQYEKENRLLRAEVYHKEYDQLVRFDATHFYDPSQYNNDGHGFARGFDLFFRDRKTFNALDYWISYSLMESERLYRTYPEKASPHFAMQHNLSIVAKKWVQSLQTQFGASLNMASGRPYHNPNKNQFMSGRSPVYSDLSLNASHLTRIWNQQLIVYTSVSNVLGRDNIHGYRFAELPDQTGNYPSRALRDPAKRFLFLGIFLTISN